MEKEKIDKDSLKELKTLSERLMAYEARQILIKSGEHKPVPHQFTERYTIPPKKVKEDILRLFQDNGYRVPDTELLKDLSLKYLDDMIGFATANPSYKELKRRIKRGKYDFLSALEFNACS